MKSNIDRVKEYLYLKGGMLLVKPIIKCNMNCPCCVNRQNRYKNILQNDKRELTFEQWIDVIQQVKTFLNIDKIIISGGEPLIYNKIFDFIKEIKKIGFNSISLHTNGSLLNKDKCKKLIDSGITSVRISLYSTTNSNFMESRGVTNTIMFKNILNNIKYFNKYKPSNVVSEQNCFISKFTINNLTTLYLQSKALCFDVLFIDLLEGCLEDNSLVNKYKINKVDINNKKIDNKFKNLCEKAIKKQYKEKIYPCEYMPLIRLNGDVDPCNVYEFTMDNVLNLFDYNLKFDKLYSEDFYQKHLKEGCKYCTKCPISVHEKFILNEE